MQAKQINSCELASMEFIDLLASIFGGLIMQYAGFNNSCGHSLKLGGRQVQVLYFDKLNMRP